jgi:hypothetical protein
VRDEDGRLADTFLRQRASWGQRDNGMEEISIGQTEPQGEAGPGREAAHRDPMRLHGAASERELKRAIDEANVAGVERPGRSSRCGGDDDEPGYFPCLSEDPEATACSAAARTVQGEQERPWPTPDRPDV